MHRSKSVLSRSVAERAEEMATPLKVAVEAEEASTVEAVGDGTAALEGVQAETAALVELRAAAATASAAELAEAEAVSLKVALAAE